MKRARLLVGLALAFAATAAFTAGPTTASASPSIAAKDPSKDPIVIVPGLWGGYPLSELYLPFAARLQREGYRTFLFRLPRFGLGHIADTSDVLAAFVERVMAETGAEKVDLIGHSLGGLLSRYYIRNLGGVDQVDSIISLATPNQGTALARFMKLFGCLGSPICDEGFPGADFINELNAGDATPGDVAYTNLASRSDAFIQPYRLAFLADDENTANILIQQQCPFKVVPHLTFPMSGAVHSGIQDALAHRPITLRC